MFFKDDKKIFFQIPTYSTEYKGYTACIYTRTKTYTIIFDIVNIHTYEYSYVIPKIHAYCNALSLFKHSQKLITQRMGFLKRKIKLLGLFLWSNGNAVINYVNLTDSYTML